VSRRRLRTLLALLALGAVLHGARGVRGGGSPSHAARGSGVEAARAAAGATAGVAAEAARADQILYREALARGLDREDEVVRRRLAANAAFLRGEPGAERERLAELAREARELGMHRTDVVVRRRLVERVKMEIAAEGRGPEPDEAALRAFHAAHPGRWWAPPRAAFRHVFFDPARRGGVAGAERAAAAALAALARGESVPGDPCLAAPAQPLQPETWIARMLGPAFSDAAFGAPLGAWTGPVRSAVGVHALLVEARTPGRTLPFTDVRERVRDALLAERATAAVARFLAAHEGDAH